MTTYIQLQFNGECLPSSLSANRQVVKLLHIGGQYILHKEQVYITYVLIDTRGLFACVWLELANLPRHRVQTTMCHRLARSAVMLSMAVISARVRKACQDDVSTVTCVQSCKGVFPEIYPVLTLHRWMMKTRQ